MPNKKRGLIIPDSQRIVINRRQTKTVRLMQVDERMLLNDKYKDIFFSEVIRLLKEVDELRISIMK